MTAECKTADFLSVNWKARSSKGKWSNQRVPS